MPDESMKLSPAGARACLRYEAEAAALADYKAKLLTETGKLNVIKGQLREARAQCDSTKTKLEAALEDNVILTQRVAELERRRWVYFGAGATTVALGLLVVVLRR